MHGWVLALMVWLLAQPILAFLLGVVCAGARREARVEETIPPTPDEPLTPAIAG